MKNQIALWIAIHLPLRVRYHATMQMVGNALMQEDFLPETITWVHIYDLLEKPKDKHAS